jgi:tRNA G18 (ribose-2'-O)-methylase SpoU
MSNPPVIGPGEFFPVVGVGPHNKPWPTDDHYDPELLENGDRRNVLDKYRYWQHDLNIGSVVRTANAFNVSSVHIVGKRDWNRRGAMVTDKYLHVIHHATVSEFQEWSKVNSCPIIGIDNVPGSLPLEKSQLPLRCVLFFGQEGAGMSDEAIAACEKIYEISQFGSTRSMNASAAAAIAMYAWGMQHLHK